MRTLQAFTFAAMLVLGIALISGGVIAFGHSESETVYKYQVSAEPVTSGNPGNVIQYENLSKPMQSLLKEAFADTNGFQGGAETTIQNGEQIDIPDDWTVIEVRGVQILVSIDEEPETKLDDYGVSGVILGIVGIMLIIVSFVFLLGVVND